MPVTSHPITFTVYQDDNSTKAASATVMVRNTTKGTELVSEQLTNANGVAILDLANLPDPSSGNKYDAGDKVLLISHKGNQHDAYMYTVAGVKKDITLYLNPAKFHSNVSSIRNIITANTAGTVAYCRVFDYYDGELIAQIETPANDTQHIHIEGGKQCKYVIEREASSLIVTTTDK